MAHHFPPTHSNVLQLARSLKLARNVVAVPRGCQKIQIEMHLNIGTSKNQGVSVNCTLSFDNNGSLSERHEVDGYEFEVKVTWRYPDSSSDYSFRRSRPREIQKLGWWRKPDISYMVGDDAEGFSSFITELRRLAADHPCCRDLMADHPELSSTRNHPVLRNGHGIDTFEGNKSVYQRERLIHINLEAVEGVETSSITLHMRDDNLDIIGFINQDGACYQHGGFPYLPREYGSKTVDGWGQYYGSTLDTGRVRWATPKTKLGKTFAAEAVRELSRFNRAKGVHDMEPLLVPLIVMVCDSATFEPVRDAIARNWDNGTELTEKLNEYRRNWRVISSALLDWRDHNYQGWPQNNKALESIGIKSSEAARQVVHLLFNDENRIIRC